VSPAESLRACLRFDADYRLRALRRRNPPDTLALNGRPYANSYNEDTRNLRFGHANDYQFNPLAGTVFDGVAPY
jgi:hypothetical protein